MNHRGYAIDPCTIVTPAGEQPAWAITNEGAFKAYTCSRDFSKHVIDVKIQTGEWPEKKPKGGTANG